MRNLLKFQSNEAYQNYYKSGNVTVPNVSKITGSNIVFLKEYTYNRITIRAKDKCYGDYENNNYVKYDFADGVTEMIIDGVKYLRENANIVHYDYRDEISITIEEDYDTYSQEYHTITYVLDKSIKNLNNDDSNGIFFFDDEDGGEFSYNSTIGDIIIPECITELSGNYIFGRYGSEDAPGKLIIPDSVTSYVNACIGPDSYFNEIYIGNGVTEIPSYLFADTVTNCKYFFKEGIQSINCLIYGMNYIDIPSTVTHVDPIINNNYNNEYYLETIIFRGTTPPEIGYEGDLIESSSLEELTNLKIYVPDASVTTYQTAWPSLENYIYPLSELTD